MSTVEVDYLSCKFSEIGPSDSYVQAENIHRKINQCHGNTCFNCMYFRISKTVENLLP